MAKSRQERGFHQLDAFTRDLAGILSDVEIAVLILDSSLRVRSYTPCAGPLLGMTPVDLGRSFRRIAARLGLAGCTAMIEEALDAGAPIERALLDKHGHRFTMRARPIQSEHGHVEGLLVALLETNLQCPALGAVREPADFARAIVETMRESLAVLDSRSRIISLNKSYCELFRVRPQDVRGKPIAGKGIGQLHSRELRIALREVQASHGGVWSLFIDQEFPEVGRRCLELYLRRMERTQTVLVVINDITQRKRALEKLEGAETTMRALLETTSQSIIAVDPQGRIVLANGNTETMFGYHREELVGNNLEILIPRESRPRHTKRHKTYFKEMASRRMAINTGLAALHKDGTTFPVEISLAAIHLPQGKLAVAFVNDITERVRLENEARARAEEVRILASRLLKAQEEERRRVSRELHDQTCQELASIAMDVGEMIADSNCPPDVARRLRSMHARIVQASDKVRHVAYQLHPSVLDDLGLISSLRSLCKELARHGVPDVNFQAENLPANLPREIASCLYRVSQECLHNVAKHARAHRVNVSVRVANRAVRLSITDDGVGFELSHARANGGLGFVSIEERVMLVNGAVSILSKPGHGTTVTITVPFEISI